MVEKPILLEVPERLVTERLELRAVTSGVGDRVNQATVESHAELSPWMVWANPCPTVKESERWCRGALARFINREELIYHGYFPGMDDFLLSIGVFQFNWDVPKMEVGYWIRTKYSRQGYMTEAVNALTQMCLERFGAERIEIRCHGKNVRSARVAERCGYVHGATLRHFARGAQKELRDTRIYARLRG